MSKNDDDQYPDPTKYLFISLEQKRKDQAKPYDGKKMFWVPDEKDCYVLANLVEEKGDTAVMDLPGGEKVRTKINEVTVITVYFAKFDDQNLADMAVDSFHFQLQ
jgi:myosin heavy chain 6/7